MKLATLTFITDPAGRHLLLMREKEPNRGLWSPVGGKFEHDLRETVHESAAREMREELLLERVPGPLRLRGLACERGVTDEGKPADWMLFIFSTTLDPALVPARGPEGELRWFARAELGRLDRPQTDIDIFWPLILEGRPFFTATIEWDGRRVTEWRLEE